MSTSPVACTIVSNNYLAYARVFTRSFLAQHPDGKVYVLIVDQPDPSLRYEDEPFTAVLVESLGIPRFRHYSFRYSILELNTAVKPWFLLHLHRLGGYDRICYFDPDILITGDLSEIYDRLGEADALLTPHITAPLEDDRTPSERDFLLSGMYNLGFLGIAFNERTLPYLDWWHRRLYKECLHEVERGLFVDQRWMDFAPSFLPGAVIYRDLGCNVAYWNLTHRSLSRRDGAWWVDGTPLRFFHFSGYRLDQPETISRYQNRFHLTGRPDLADLFLEYGERITAEGHLELQRLRYRFGFFDDGTPVPNLARVALRRTDPDGHRWPNPFAVSGPDTFLGWLAEPLAGSGLGTEITLPRFALLLWDQRADLQEAFPRPEKEDRARFASWFAHGMESPAYGEIFTRPVAESLRQARHLPPGQIQEVGNKVTSTVFGDRSLIGDLPAEEVSWLTADAGHEPQRRPRISRLALMLHQRRADLRGFYPDPLGADRERFAIWFSTYGRQEYQFPRELISPVLRSLPLRKALWVQLWWQRQRVRHLSPPNPLPGTEASLIAAKPAGDAGDSRLPPAPRSAPSGHGLNVVGWASAPTGVGEACRGTLLALETSGVPTALWNLGSCAADDPLRGGTQGLPFDTILFHVNADMIPVVTRQLPRVLLAGRYRIGYWFWELSHFPLAFVESFHHLDEVWAPTRFCLDAFKAISPLQVRWMPPCVAPPTEGPADRQALGIPPESFLFYFAFDALSIPERKNPDGLLRAFARAVRESRRPLHLLLKVNHLDTDPALGQHLLRQIGNLPVTLLTDSMSRAQVNSLMAACDAYVSLHRSEGLGLPLIEAMYLGKPVIATGYGGVTDFFDDSTGWVVRHTMTALEEAQGPYPVGAVWADPDAGHAAELMVQIAAAPEAAAGRIEAARRRVAEIYAPEAAGARLQRELGRLAQLRDEPVRTRQRRERPAVAG